jgi:crossover junction endodeoxyribonuclease RuvC
MIILGIDPGLVATGLGVITTEQGSSRLLDTRVVRTHASEPLVRRLGRIHTAVVQTIDRWNPEVVVVESLFFAKNVRSAVLLAHARAAAMLAASNHPEIQLIEYSPLEIKQAVAGYGRAGKQQIQRMVAVLLRPDPPVENEHISDALACALCHAHRQDRPLPVAEEDPSATRSPAKELLSLARKGRRRRR